MIHYISNCSFSHIGTVQIDCFALVVVYRYTVTLPDKADSPLVFPLDNKFEEIINKSGFWSVGYI